MYIYIYIYIQLSLIVFAMRSAAWVISSGSSSNKRGPRDTRSLSSFGSFGTTNSIPPVSPESYIMIIWRCRRRRRERCASAALEREKERMSTDILHMYYRSYIRKKRRKNVCYERSKRKKYIFWRRRAGDWRPSPRDSAWRMCAFHRRWRVKLFRLFFQGEKKRNAPHEWLVRLLLAPI